MNVELRLSTSSVSAQTVANRKQLFSAASMNDKMLHYYTGLESFTKFESVLATFGREAYLLVNRNKTTSSQ